MNAYNNKHTKTNVNSYAYTHGTEAYDYDILEQHKPTRNKRKSKKKAVSFTTDGMSFAFSLSLCGLIMFMSAMGYINVYSTFNSTQLKLRELKEESIEINSKISKCQSVISENMDVDKITSKAMELGYRKPYQYQIVYIELPDHSRTFYAD